MDRDIMASETKSKPQGTAVDQLSVVLPAYNEEPNIERVVRAVVPYLEARGFDYELLVVKFKKRSPNPHFLPTPAEKLKEYGQGLTIIRADQCAHSVRFAREVSEVARREFHLEPKIIVQQSCREAQNAPTPYAVFSIILDGELLCDHQISKTRFRNIMNKRQKAGLEAL